MHNSKSSWQIVLLSVLCLTLICDWGSRLTVLASSITQSSGIVNPGTINQLAWYAATGSIVSGLSVVNNALLVTSAGGVPSESTAIPNGVTATTQASGSNDTKVATDAYVDGKTAFTNSQVNVDSSLGTSTGAGLYIPGTSLTVGNIYYEASGGLTAAKADASTTVPAVCIAISTTACMMSGVYRFGSSQSWTAGNILYVSASSGGAIVTTAPSTSGQYVQRIGVALANDTAFFQPSLDVGSVQ